MHPEFDVDLLRTFIAVVETGSFTKAATMVHRSQAAVSMQIKRLETMLGSSRRSSLATHAICRSRVPAIRCSNTRGA